MSEIKHKRIWLEPAHESDAYGERQWFQQNVWGDNADEYVLASSLSKQPAFSPSIASLQAENERLKAENQRVRKILRKIEQGHEVRMEDGSTQMVEFPADIVASMIDEALGGSNA